MTHDWSLELVLIAVGMESDRLMYTARSTLGTFRFFNDTLNARNVSSILRYTCSGMTSPPFVLSYLFGHWSTSHCTVGRVNDHPHNTKSKIKWSISMAKLDAREAGGRAGGREGGREGDRGREIEGGREGGRYRETLLLCSRSCWFDTFDLGLFSAVPERPIDVLRDGKHLRETLTYVCGLELMSTL